MLEEADPHTGLSTIKVDLYIGTDTLINDTN